MISIYTKNHLFLTLILLRTSLFSPPGRLRAHLFHGFNYIYGNNIHENDVTKNLIPMLHTSNLGNLFKIDFNLKIKILFK